MKPAPFTLVLGGARSGKSRHAQALVEALPAPWTYIATAEALDTEMRVRIDRHRSDRGAGWRTVEAPHDLPGALRDVAVALPLPGPVLVDCATLWLSNRLLAGADPDGEGDALVRAVAARSAPVVVVSNEVGFGIVPDNALARAFRDAQGRLNQRLAAAADRVVLVVAGLPLTVKGGPG